jgi:tellurite resistance protein
MEKNRLQNFQISFFAMVLGFVGFALVLQKTEEFFHFPAGVTSFFLILAITVFAVVLIAYLLKILFRFASFKEDFNHPIKVNFFPLIAKNLLILSVIFLPINMLASKYLWISGVLLQLIFSFVIISRWLSTKFEIQQINPSWFIPIVGSVIVPIAGIKHFSPEISWFFFSGGLIWWLLLFVIVIYRIIFHNPMHNKFLPTFFILFAPPAIAFIALVKLTGELSPLGRILYHISFFMFMLIMLQSYKFRKIDFYLSWWAYSFPTVAITVATVLMYHLTHEPFYKYLVFGMFGLLILIMFYLTFRTFKAIKNKEICIEE